jgi:hypothetical protein
MRRSKQAGPMWLNPAQLTREFKYLTPRALAWQLNNRAWNGLAAHIRVKPGQHLINAKGYAAWVRSKTTAGDSDDNGGQS